MTNLVENKSWDGADPVLVSAADPDIIHSFDVTNPRSDTDSAV